MLSPTEDDYASPEFEEYSESDEDSIKEDKNENKVLLELDEEILGKREEKYQ